MTSSEWILLFIIATLGHVMALLWYVALKRNWAICQRTICALPIKEAQIRRELKNSIHTPLHAVLLLLFLWMGFFRDSGVLTAFLTLICRFSRRTDPGFPSRTDLSIDYVPWVRLGSRHV